MIYNYTTNQLNGFSLRESLLTFLVPGAAIPIAIRKIKEGGVPTIDSSIIDDIDVRTEPLAETELITIPDHEPGEPIAQQYVSDYVENQVSNNNFLPTYTWQSDDPELPPKKETKEKGFFDFIGPVTLGTILFKLLNKG